MSPEIVGNFEGRHVRVGIVSARFNSVVTDRLEAGAIDCFVRHGVPEDHITVVRVPGAFEIPTAARLLLAHRKVDGVVGLGCVIRGETDHDRHLAHAVANGLTEITLRTGTPVAFGVVTANTLAQARARAGGGHGDKGQEAAVAAIEMARLLPRLSKPPGEIS